jgi:two-component system, NarL family, nitrate/nitrite response regulator NarL
MTPTVIIASTALLREGVTSLLQGTPFKVVTAVRNPAELANRDLTDRALAIVGIYWSNGTHGPAAESIRLLRSLMPAGKIVVVAETCGPVDLQCALECALGLAPDGHILNLDSRDTLLRALELIFMDQQIFVLGRTTGALTNGRDDTQRPTRALTNGGDHTQFPERTLGSQSESSYESGKKTNHSQLSDRERQVLISLAHGQSNKEIARAYDISEATVKVHTKAILRKTNIRNRTQAAIWVIEHGPVDAESRTEIFPERSRPVPRRQPCQSIRR